jgi:hypothetical protein
VTAPRLFNNSSLGTRIGNLGGHTKFGARGRLVDVDSFQTFLKVHTHLTIIVTYPNILPTNATRYGMLTHSTAILHPSPPLDSLRRSHKTQRRLPVQTHLCHSPLHLDSSDLDKHPHSLDHCILTRGNISLCAGADLLDRGG